MSGLAAFLGLSFWAMSDDLKLAGQSIGGSVTADLKQLLDTNAGTGPEGKVTAEDIAAYLEKRIPKFQLNEVSTAYSRAPTPTSVSNPRTLFSFKGPNGPELIGVTQDPSGKVEVEAAVWNPNTRRLVGGVLKQDPQFQGPSHAERNQVCNACHGGDPKTGIGFNPLFPRSPWDSFVGEKSVAGKVAQVFGANFSSGTPREKRAKKKALNDELAKIDAVIAGIPDQLSKTPKTTRSLVIADATATKPASRKLVVGPNPDYAALISQQTELTALRAKVMANPAKPDFAALGELVLKANVLPDPNIKFGGIQIRSLDAEKVAAVSFDTFGVRPLARRQQSADMCRALCKDEFTSCWRSLLSSALGTSNKTGKIDKPDWIFQYLNTERERFVKKLQSNWPDDDFAYTSTVIPDASVKSIDPTTGQPDVRTYRVLIESDGTTENRDQLVKAALANPQLIRKTFRDDFSDLDGLRSKDLHDNGKFDKPSVEVPVDLTEAEAKQLGVQDVRQAVKRSKLGKVGAVDPQDASRLFADPDFTRACLGLTDDDVGLLKGLSEPEIGQLLTSPEIRKALDENVNERLFNPLLRVGIRKFLVNLDPACYFDSDLQVVNTDSVPLTEVSKPASDDVDLDEPIKNDKVLVKFLKGRPQLTTMDSCFACHSPSDPAALKDPAAANPSFAPGEPTSNVAVAIEEASVTGKLSPAAKRAFLTRLKAGSHPPFSVPESKQLADKLIDYLQK